MQFAIPQLSTQILNPTTESKRAVRQLIGFFKGTHNSCLRLEPHMMVQKGLIEPIGCGDTDWAGDSATRQSATGYHLQCARNDDVPPKPETDNNLSQFSRSRVSTQPVLAQENFWVSQNSSKNFTATFQFVPKWIQIRHVTFSSEEKREGSSTLRFDAWLFNKNR